jgi:type II secretory pathway component PulJ
MRNGRTTRPALTLVEITVALAILAMLAVATLRAVTHLARSQRRQDAHARATERGKPLEALLEADLLHAERIRLADRGGGFEVEGLAQLEPETLHLAHRPAVVRYELREAGGRTWLVRIQQCGGEKPRAELVTGGVHSMAATLEGGGGREDEKKANDKWVARPERVTVTVHYEDGETHTVQFVER